MVLVETSVFTRFIRDLMGGDEYRELQNALVANPEVGKVIRGSGGLRKTRVSRDNLGKSKGLPLIYYYAEPQQQLLMLYIYPKSQATDLTPAQVAVLRRIIEATYP